MEKKNIYLFYGEDTYSAYQKAKFWRQEFEKKYGDYNFHTFEGHGLETPELLASASAVPFLGDKKLIVVKDFLRDAKEDQQKILAQQLESVPDFTVLLFMEEEKPDARTVLFKKLKQIGQIQEFESPVGAALEKFIQTMVTAKQVSLGHGETALVARPEAVLLAEYIPDNLWQLSQEVDKLLLYSEGRPVTRAMIDQLVTPSVSSSVFQLTDALGQKNPKTALKIFQNLLDSGEDVVMIFFMMVRHFRILLQVKYCLEQKLTKPQILQKLSEKPFVVSIAMGQAKNFTFESLKAVYKKLLAIDVDLKSGKIRMSTVDNTEFRLAVEKLVVQMGL